jgi:hypothetical protein
VRRPHPGHLLRKLSGVHRTGSTPSAIIGTCRRISREHAHRYLASFAWRFNRRYQLDTILPRLVHSAAKTAPLPYRALVAS